MKFFSLLYLAGLSFIVLFLFGCTSAPAATSGATATATVKPAPLPAATQAPPSDGPQPLVVWIEQDPWLAVLGADSPALALYDTGQVIYRDSAAEGLSPLVTARLSPAELDQLWQSLAIDDRFFNLADNYDEVPVTDQPAHTLMVWDQDRFKRVRVYGDLRGNDFEARTTAPEAFLKLFDQLVRFHHPQAEPWRPEKVEVLAWPYDTSEAFTWPAGWPDLNHPETRQRGEDSYSIFITWAQFEELNQLVEANAPAARINDQTWSLSYRLPFPNETAWMGARR